MGSDRHANPRGTAAVVVGGATALAAIATYLYRNDPHLPGTLFPQCPFYALTGWHCPGCGGLRMTYDLLHGDVAMAARDNLFLLLGLPVLIGWLLLQRRRAEPMPAIGLVVTMFAAMVGWTVLRNVPGFPLVPTLR